MNRNKESEHCDATSIFGFNAATTKVLPSIAEAMCKTMTENYGNPSSIYKLGQQAKNILDTAREQVAELINASPKEIIFTGAAAKVIRCCFWVLLMPMLKRASISLQQQLLHHAILHICQFRKSEGYTVTYLPVDEFGKVDPVTSQ